MKIENLDWFITKAIELNATGKSNSEIEKILKDNGADAIEIEAAISAVKKKVHKQRSSAGTKKLGIAVLFLLAGFVITIFNFHSNQSFTAVMYSFTSIGLFLLFWGLYEIIG
ncbi:MAG: hypothetical protein ACK5QC_10745 [Bacteroidota bacterium]|jgi:hypothetical protein|nr:hypothetical protein [Bacteroidota bacterium]MCA6444410.1 hypothetical protein [Bacteroidota bacterium]